MKKDKSLIPIGNYCSVCPYWEMNWKLAEEQGTIQGCGYCNYLERGDWDAFVPPDMPEGFPLSALSLLWDKVKECNENTYEEIAGCDTCKKLAEDCEECMINIMGE